jgi:uncharacterized protein YdiU (UPF0061 family)
VDQGLFAFDNSYARLPERFFAHQEPTPVAAPRLLRLNTLLASELELDSAALRTADGVNVFAGNHLPQGASPLSMAYAGHQFGNWVPQLGDGRAVLLGEVIDRHGQRRDIQLKGAGPTPYSRMGDGRAAIGPVLREYIVSEAMAAMAVPTTRALAAVSTGEAVFRERVLPGAILTRVATSHIRVGTFQFFAARQDIAGLGQLADHVIARHYPEAAAAAQPYLAMFEAILNRQAHLIARWMAIGFIHGVMNTDNMSIAGETIDYGPCAFMDVFHPETVFSSIDRDGRYAYINQPGIGQWNLACLAQSLLPLLDPSEDVAVAAIKDILDTFPQRFEAAYRREMGAKLGLTNAPAGGKEDAEGDMNLIRDWLQALADNHVDFSLAHRHLGSLDITSDAAKDAAFLALFNEPETVAEWLPAWRQRLAAETSSDSQRQANMMAVNALYIPRNHLVEEAIAAAENDDFGPFDELCEVLSRPFEAQPGRERFAEPPTAEQVVTQTFCGT